MRDELFYQLALQFIPGVGNGNAKHLIGYCGSAGKVFEARSPQLKKIPGIGEKTIRSIREQSSFKKSEEILLDCEKNEIKVLHFTSPNYPDRLKSIYDAPNILYYKGKGDLNLPKSISIVGTRNATGYGKSITKKIIQELRSSGTCIVSGLAYGIDIEAHKQSLKAGLPTIAVLAGGLDRIYPDVHKKTAYEMIETGGLLSENPPGIKPEAHLFPARNRIIAGLGDATLVIEAGAKGGALITANIADSYDRPVFAVPGNIDQPFSYGCNELIRSQKALIYTGVEGLSYYLNWDVQNEPKRPVIELEPEEQLVVGLLEQHESGIAIDELSWKSQLQINKLASLLLTLEFKGVIKSLPGKKYQLNYL